MSFIERLGNANPFASIDVGNHSTPTFADIDGDGDKDLIVGSEIGALNYYRNEGNGKYTELEFSPILSIYATDLNSTVSFADLDRDGDLDAIVGSRNGKLDYFQNNGVSGGKLQWQRTEANSPFRTYNLNKPSNFTYSAATFVDWDRDGDLDGWCGQWTTPLLRKYKDHLSSSLHHH